MKPFTKTEIKAFQVDLIRSWVSQGMEREEAYKLFREMYDLDPPIHDCEIMGKDTEYVEAIDIETDERSWICIWCEMAKKFKGEV